MPETLLAATGIEAGYPNKQILFGIDFTISAGEVVALLGAAGSDGVEVAILFVVLVSNKGAG